MKHILLTAIIAGSMGLTASVANAQYRAPAVKPITTTLKPAAPAPTLVAPRAGIAAPKISPNAGAGMVAAGGGNAINRPSGMVAAGGGNFRR